MPSYIRCGCHHQNGRDGSGLIVPDENASILHPAAGVRQRFCYHVYAADDQGAVYAPLMYIVLGLGSGVTQQDIYAVSVAVNGVMQHVVWGQNAWLVTAAAPDGNTGCAGLKLAIPLANATDVMDVCLTMNRVFTVGAISSCFFAGGAAYTTPALPAPLQAEGDACPAIAYQEVDVCLPVVITPYVTVGDAAVTCCGAPAISQGDEACPGAVGGQCAFTISQRMCVALPVTFGANTQAGEYSVACGNAGEGNCDGCTVANAAVAAARQAVEEGMIRMPIADPLPANAPQPPLPAAESPCRPAGAQTRIQDLIRDPMIWRD